jgi:hypothetical protein
MRVLKVSKEEAPVNSIRLDSPVSTPGGSFCAPLYIGHGTSETLGLQLGPAAITGLVQTPRVCYLDLELNEQQVAWVQLLEAAVLAQLPGNTTIWFTRDMQPTDVEYFYDGSLRGNKLRASVLRCNTFDTIDLQVFEESGEPGEIGLIEGAGTVLALIHVQGVSHRQGRLSIDWVVQQVLVKRATSCRIALGSEPEGSEADADADAVAEAEAEADEAEPPAHPTPLEVMANPITELFETDTMPIADAELELRPEAELVSDELEIQAREERARRSAALRLFMEANGLEPDDYEFPDTDQESDDEVVQAEA